MKKLFPVLLLLFMCSVASATCNKGTAELKRVLPPVFFSVVPNTLTDTCSDCQTVTEANLTRCMLNRANSKCDCVGAAAEYCFNHCSPCQFCVAWGEIWNEDCAVEAARK